MVYLKVLLYAFLALIVVAFLLFAFLCMAVVAFQHGPIGRGDISSWANAVVTFLGFVAAMCAAGFAYKANGIAVKNYYYDRSASLVSKMCDRACAAMMNFDMVFRDPEKESEAQLHYSGMASCVRQATIEIANMKPEIKGDMTRLARCLLVNECELELKRLGRLESLRELAEITSGLNCNFTHYMSVVTQLKDARDFLYPDDASGSDVYRKWMK